MAPSLCKYYVILCNTNKRLSVSNEFVLKYVETRQKLQERRTECMQKIVDHARQETEVAIKLEEAKRTERLNAMGIRDDSKLKVHIVDAVNLDENTSSQVKVYQDHSMSETKVRVGSGPIWNEAIIFDITDQFQPIVVQVVTTRGEVILENDISLMEDQIRDYRMQGQDIWCYRSYDEDRGGDGVEDGPKLRVRIHYSYSDVMRYDSLLLEWQEFITEDIVELQWIERYLDQLSDPFTFFAHMSEKTNNLLLGKEEKEDLDEQQRGDNQYHFEEKQVEEYVDAQAQRIANNMGYRQVPWTGVIYCGLVLQMMLSMLSQYARKDFIVMTACCLGFYFMEFPQTVRRRMFRGMVGLLAMSLIYDVVWYLINRDLEEDESGGVERQIKDFSLKVSYVSFAFRVSTNISKADWKLLQIPLMLVLHKASLDFLTIVKGKNTNDKEGVTLEEKVREIIADHENARIDDGF